MIDMLSHPDIDSLFPIGTASTLTGVNAVTLRAWERRYGLIKPVRTESGHRLYSESDVERIRAVLRLLDEGIAISRVNQALEQRKRENEAPPPGDASHWDHYLEILLRAVVEFDEARLDATCNEAMSLYPVDVVTQRLLLPLLKKLGERWREEATGVAEEHFFSVFMRNKLGARFHHRNLQNSGPCIIAACLPGEQHEFGLLLFTLAAHSRGYRVVLLGADMPLTDIPHVIRRTHARAVVLSGSTPAVESELEQKLTDLIRAGDVPVLIGGSYARDHFKSLEKLGIYAVGEDLNSGLRTLLRLVPSVFSH